MCSSFKKMFLSYRLISSTQLGSARLLFNTYLSQNGPCSPVDRKPIGCLYMAILPSVSQILTLKFCTHKLPWNSDFSSPCYGTYHTYDGQLGVFWGLGVCCFSSLSLLLLFFYNCLCSLIFLLLLVTYDFLRSFTVVWLFLWLTSIVSSCF